MIEKIIFEIIVFLSNIIQCITGFAGTVLAMPFSVMLVGYDTAKPILNILGIAASIGVLLAERKSVNKKEFIKIISVMFAGIIAGMFLVSFFKGNASVLYKLLGTIVIIFALVNGIKFLKKKESGELNPVAAYAILIAAGVVHGMFVCGGPLLVTYASMKLKDTKEFRATLSAVWIVLNTVILFGDIGGGYFNSDVLVLTGVSLIVLIGAVRLGNLISKKLSKNVFLALTYILMLISGISLFVK